MEVTSVITDINSLLQSCFLELRTAMQEITGVIRKGARNKTKLIISDPVVSNILRRGRQPREIMGIATKDMMFLKLCFTKTPP